VANNNNTLTVSILDREFRINCPADSQHELTAAAKLLNDKMNEIRNASSNTGNVLGIDRIAVIAALNITHQLQTLQKQQNQIVEEVERMNERLDEAFFNSNLQLELD
jgi:cell division protein ZapA